MKCKAVYTTVRSLLRSYLILIFNSGEDVNPMQNCTTRGCWESAHTQDSKVPRQRFQMGQVTLFSVYFGESYLTQNIFSSTRQMILQNLNREFTQQVILGNSSEMGTHKMRSLFRWDRSDCGWQQWLVWSTDQGGCPGHPQTPKKKQVLPGAHLGAQTAVRGWRNRWKQHSATGKKKSINDFFMTTGAMQCIESSYFHPREANYGIISQRVSRNTSAWSSQRTVAELFSLLTRDIQCKLFYYGITITPD